MEKTGNISVVTLILKGFICLNNINPNKKYSIDDFIKLFNWRAITPYTLSKEELQSILDLLVKYSNIDVEEIENTNYYCISDALIKPSNSILNENIYTNLNSTISNIFEKNPFKNIKLEERNYL